MYSYCPRQEHCSAPDVACAVHSARCAAECTATAMPGNAVTTHGTARQRTATHGNARTANHGISRQCTVKRCYRTVHITACERQCSAISRLTRLSTAKHGKARQSTVKQRICSKALLQRCSARHVDTLWKRCYSRHGMRGNTRQLTAATRCMHVTADDSSNTTHPG